MEIYKIGKNIIENLTTGMYQDSKIIFREYIQNSADQIDKAKKNNLFDGEKLFVSIEIDPDGRNIRIKDNATGIEANKVKERLANIADSYKDRDENKGFRGIGRLGGLAYCDTLRFITSYAGEEIETIMTWNAKLLRDLINDKTVKDSAEEILRKVVTFETFKCEKNKHFFTVELEHVKKENNELLDAEEVKRYISSNAPVAYNTDFYLVSKIFEYIKLNDIVVCEYDIQLNGMDIHKNYKTHLYENMKGSRKKYDKIYDVEFKEFKNKKGEPIAWMWFGVSEFIKQIPSSSKEIPDLNEMRGIRLRKENIQIGDENTLVPLFKEQRGNFYFVGEVHAMHKDLIPNARRDYFNENTARVEFEAELRYYFENTLHKLYYEASRIKSCLKKEISFNEVQNEYEDKSKIGFIGDDEKEKLHQKIENSKKEFENSKNDIIKIKEKAKNNELFEKVIEIIEKNHEEKIANVFNLKDEEKKDVKLEKKENEQNYKREKGKYLTDGLHKLDNKQRKLVSKIYDIISNSLPSELSQTLILKIQEELNK